MRPATITLEARRLNEPNYRHVANSTKISAPVLQLVILAPTSRTALKLESHNAILFNQATGTRAQSSADLVFYRSKALRFLRFVRFFRRISRLVVPLSINLRSAASQIYQNWCLPLLTICFSKSSLLCQWRTNSMLAANMILSVMLAPASTSFIQINSDGVRVGGVSAQCSPSKVVNTN